MKGVINQPVTQKDQIPETIKYQKKSVKGQPTS